MTAYEAATSRSVWHCPHCRIWWRQYAPASLCARCLRPGVRGPLPVR